MPSIEENFSSSESLDRPFLTENPRDILRKGTYVKLPFLLGFNSHEAMLFVRSKFRTEHELFLPIYFMVYYILKKFYF